MIIFYNFLLHHPSGKISRFSIAYGSVLNDSLFQIHGSRQKTNGLLLARPWCKYIVLPHKSQNTTDFWMNAKRLGRAEHVSFSIKIEINSDIRKKFYCRYNTNKKFFITTLKLQHTYMKKVYVFTVTISMKLLMRRLRLQRRIHIKVQNRLLKKHWLTENW